MIGNTGNSNDFYKSGENIYDKSLLNTPKIYDFQKNNELTEDESKFKELEKLKILS